MTKKKRRNSVVSCYASKEVVHSFWDDVRCSVYDEVVQVHSSYAVEVVPERSSYVIEVEEVHYLVFVEVVEEHFSSSSSSSSMSCCYDERLLRQTSKRRKKVDPRRKMVVPRHRRWKMKVVPHRPLYDSLGVAVSYPPHSIFFSPSH